MTFIASEDNDQTFEIAFTFRKGTDFFGAWEVSGNFQVQIFDPNNQKIHQETLTVPHPFDEVFANGIDNRTRTFAIPADGKTGNYRIEISVDKAGPVFSLASNTLGKTAIYVPPEGVMLDRGRYYFYVPAESTQFILRSANWASFILFDPDR